MRMCERIYFIFFGADLNISLNNEHVIWKNVRL